MDDPMPSLREQGLQALRAGSIEPAVDLLARAVIADPHDAEAQAFLGVAYSQKGVHAPAKRALESAIELQPRNAGFRFNLGVALEQAGDRQGAASAYSDALQINPEHAQAQARGQSLAAQTAAAPISARRIAAPPIAPSLSNAPWLRGRETPSAVPAGPPGTVQCPHCHQYSKPGMSCEWCSSPLKGAPMAASHATGGYLESVQSSRVDVEDEFDLAQSFHDWVGGPGFAQPFLQRTGGPRGPQGAAGLPASLYSFHQPTGCNLGHAETHPGAAADVRRHRIYRGSRDQ